MRAQSATASDSEIARAVREGLSREPRALPAWLFYDARGSDLFEQITELPEYYLTRAERSILEDHADEIVAWAGQGSSAPLHVVELGAGSATKTDLLLSAVVRKQGRCLYLPIDVSESALSLASARIGRELPRVEVRPVASTHEAAVPAISAVGPRRMLLFLGSSIGNYDDHEAIRLLSTVRQGLAPGAALLLGTDTRKDPQILLPAYDDAAGVTAAFNKNLWVRFNRELGADFDLDRWRHVAVWNDRRSRIEMHLESACHQEVRFPAIDLTVRFAEGERVHTESSYKYTRERVREMLDAAGFTSERVLSDAGGLFDLHLARLR